MSHDSVTLPVSQNLDQRAQFTSRAFTKRLRKGGMQIGMDGRGRNLDNVSVERVWHNVTYFAPPIVLSVGYTSVG